MKPIDPTSPYAAALARERAAGARHAHAETKAAREHELAQWMAADQGDLLALLEQDAS